MKIKDMNWAIPTNANKNQLLRAWEARFCAIEKSARHWQEGRSAQALADFFVNHHGEERIKNEVNKVLVQDPIVEWKLAEIECKCPFDDYRNARRQDMGIVGKTQRGKNVFIGIEAKVDETFGPTVGAAYRKAQEYKRQHPKSRSAERIVELCKRFGVKPEDKEISELRYQLFHYAAGTASVPMNKQDWIAECGSIDVHIMMTLVFKTARYSADKGCKNKADYDNFVGRFFKNGCLKDIGLPSRPYAIYCEVSL